MSSDQIEEQINYWQRQKDFAQNFQQYDAITQKLRMLSEMLRNLRTNEKQALLNEL